MVSGPSSGCLDNLSVSCGDMYGYRELKWRLSSISTGGGGELTIIDQARGDKNVPTCRRVVPFRAVLVNP